MSRKKHKKCSVFKCNALISPGDKLSIYKVCLKANLSYRHMSEVLPFSCTEKTMWLMAEIDQTVTSYTGSFIPVKPESHMKHCQWTGEGEKERE